jgi:hypothetical protein
VKKYSKGDMNMNQEVKKVRCPICNKGHICDVSIGTKFKVSDIKTLTKEELTNKVILKCPKGPHCVALEIT